MQLPGYKLDWRRWPDRWSNLGERPIGTIFLFEKRKENQTSCLDKRERAC